jgi:catechol 2,3-dioxygenase-like lactoylglutathione lyase family enzyme
MMRKLSWDDVSVVIDHLGLPATNAEAAAQWFAEILGLKPPVPDGPDADMFSVALSGTGSVVFVTQPSVSGHHVAFGVSEAEFTAIVERLRGGGISFGNDPEDPANGATADPLGGRGRVYFRSPDGHFLEVTVATV